MLDVARTVWSEDRLNVNIQCLCERMVDVDEELAAAVSDVERLAVGLPRREARLEVCLNDVLDVGEVAALAAITVDGRLLALQQELDELGDDGRVGALRILTSPEDVEVAQADGRQAVVPRVLLRPFLIAALRQGIRREEVAFAPLRLRQVRLVAIDG